MKHPQSRAERRHNGETWRNRQRYIMVVTWSSYRTRRHDPTENNMWWGRKKTYGHGNRCMCHHVKRTERRKRREALNRTIIENLISFASVVQ